MGAHSSKPNTKAALAKFDAETLLEVKQVFHSLAARQTPHNKIDRDTFLQFFPLQGQLGSALFDIFDQDHAHQIDYNEFMCGLAVCSHGTAQEKTDMLFAVFNLNHDLEKGVNRRELFIMLFSTLQSVLSLHNGWPHPVILEPGSLPLPPLTVDSCRSLTNRLVADAFDRFDVDHSDALSKEQFTDWATHRRFISEAVFEAPAARVSVALDESAMPKKASSAAVMVKSPSTQRKMGSIALSPGSASNGDGNMFMSPSWRGAMPITGWLYRPKSLAKSFLASRSKLVRSYFVLQGEYLYAYKSEDDEHPDLSTFVSGALVEPVNDVARPPPAAGVRVHLLDLDFVLVAESVAVRDDWLHALRRAAHVRVFDDHYTLGAELGRGTYSVVMRASEKRADGKPTSESNDVAVKVIEKAGLEDDEERAMLRQEISILRLLGRHDNLMRLLDVYEDETHVWIVTELLQGGDLLGLLGPDEEKRILPEEQARDLVRQLFRGLASLHDIGIVHRDIKPGNICFTNAGHDHIKIVDFGLGRLSHPEEKISFPVGTLKYFAPEMVAASGSSYNTPVDLWAAGIILYRMLCGVFAFVARDREHLIERIAIARFERLSDEFKGLHEQPKSLILGLLKQTPSKRLTAHQALQHPWLSKGSGPMSLEEAGEVESFDSDTDARSDSEDDSVFKVEIEQ